MMHLEAMDGRVVLKLYKPEIESKLVMPDSVQLEEFPTMEIIHVGRGKESPYTNKREEIPLKVGDRVVVANNRCVMVPVEGEKHFIIEWTAIYARVWEAKK